MALCATADVQSRADEAHGGLEGFGVTYISMPVGCQIIIATTRFHERICPRPGVGNWNKDVFALLDHSRDWLNQKGDSDGVFAATFEFNMRHRDRDDCAGFTGNQHQPKT